MALRTPVTLLAVSALSLSPVGRPCTAQAAGSTLANALPATSAPSHLTVPLAESWVRQRRSTTFLERLAWGAGAGLLGGAAASAIVKDDGDGAWIALPLIGAASAGGVMLVASAHEGARPWSTLLGTAVAMTVPVLVFATLDQHPEGPTGAQLAVGFAVLLSAPLGASAGHGLGGN